eukprot:CAMPEP_0181183982 /NCGR_PEP_ID=MMETSP1096-20121128/8721_1 /TAXON_ID=156174 ORGANISM="Chrysochromulina ericina, Strain CCMP281" /NCGR_SAMPLE_ID=MMETSP1096 /ASSEMBLY_ACC=CAM_ASM_000453 /LENGTH=36 /DNA_ID= /DNA_START= /DNA_END= /DNA_ORIENTATION=
MAAPTVAGARSVGTASTAAPKPGSQEMAYIWQGLNL